jgi:hypothetical protein
MIAHIAGVPIEETLAMAVPAIGVAHVSRS